MRNTMQDEPTDAASNSLATKCCTSNLRALWAVFILSTGFASTQAVGATAANSLSLLADTGTMFIDSVTYIINIAAEYHKARLNARESALVEIGACLLSVIALLVVTVAIFIDALIRLHEPSGAEVVNPVIMLVFTALNLVIDFAMFTSIVLRRTGGLGGCLFARCTGTGQRRRRGCSLFGLCCSCCGIVPRRDVGMSPKVKHIKVAVADDHDAIDKLGAKIAARVAADLAAAENGGSSSQANGSSCSQPATNGAHSADLAPAKNGAAAAALEAAATTADHGMRPQNVAVEDAENGNNAAAAAAAESIPPQPPLPEPPPLLDMSDLDLTPQHDLNLCSAFAHVLADTMRALTTFCCALLVILGGLEPDRTDAVGSLIVCFVILLVAGYVAYETLSHCRALRRGGASAASSSSPGSTISPTTHALAEEDGETPRSETAAAAATA